MYDFIYTIQLYDLHIHIHYTYTTHITKQNKDFILCYFSLCKYLLKRKLPSTLTSFPLIVYQNKNNNFNIINSNKNSEKQ